jgi:hypothetical protein
VKYHRAQDTFVADLEDGTSVRVVKGEVLPEGHELVRRDAAGTGQLFRPLDTGEDEKPAPKPSAASRAAAKVTGKAS